MCACVFSCMHGGGEEGAGGRKVDLRCVVTHA